MAYEFAGALRATGWPPEDVSYARALWIGGEYSGNPLLAYLDAGFSAGYLGDPIPSAQDVASTERALDEGFAEILPDGRPIVARAVRAR